MTLATRCPSCGTVFRVVQDQLRVSEGWVRCGRCNGVFDATEVLFDIDSGAAVSLPSPESEATPALAENEAAAPSPFAAPPPPAPPPPPPLPSPLPPPPPPSPAPPAEIEPRWLDDGPVEPRFAASGLPDAAPDHPYREEPLLRAPSRSNDDELADADDRIVITDHVPTRLPIQAPDAWLAPPATEAAPPAAPDPALTPELGAALAAT
ncbi:MAG: zinc-ribbon domain-containing protein, partial [Aquabacterium sp.]|nr:zinc-ribbon domain-containing protein [Aquabacterium sp.]